MADAPNTATSPAPAPSSAATSAASESAADTELFGKYTAQHERATRAEIEKEDAPALSKVGRHSPGVPAAGASTGGAAGRVPGRDDARSERDGAARAARETDDAGAAARSEVDGADGEAAPEAAGEGSAEGALSEADAIALLRKSRDDGDQAGIDRALKALMPGSKGLSEFNVDGKRYTELRTTAKKVQKKLDERAAQLSTRETHLEHGQRVLNQVVARLEPIEQLVQAARGDDVDAFITLVEKATGKPFNETAKRHLDKRLGKAVDPEVDALKRELQSEKEARLERERKETEAREQAGRTEQIRQHLVFLGDTLGKSEDGRVRALVQTREGMKEIFETQRAHYDPRTKTTLTAEAAAKLVLDRKQKELAPWRQVLEGGASSPAPAPAAPAPAETQPRVRSLSSRAGAGAAAGAQRLSEAELFDKYERIHKTAGD